MSDIIKIPDFLDVKYLGKVLQTVNKDPTIDVLNFTIEPATASGNNYASLLIRSHIKYTKNNKRNNTFIKRVIIKTILPDSGSAKAIDDVCLYDKELVMYDRILPKYHELLRTAGDNDELFSPALYVDHRNKALIFNDLKVMGYETGDRILGLDRNHVTMVLTKLAKFHACSMVLKEQSDETYPEFIEPCIRDNYIGEKFFKRMFCTCIDEVRKWPGYEIYANKLDNIKDLLLKQGEELFTKESKYPFKVLLHGDIWTSNIMFKYDKNQDKNSPDDAILIDFQIGCYGAPILDLIQFFYTSTNDKMRQMSFFEILKFYHAELLLCLKKLRFMGKRPRLFHLYTQYYEKSFFEVFNIIVVFPIMINTQTNDADMNSLLGDTEKAEMFRKQLYSNRKYVKILQDMLPKWNSMGLLDPLE